MKLFTECIFMYNPWHTHELYCIYTAWGCVCVVWYFTGANWEIWCHCCANIPCI